MKPRFVIFGSMRTGSNYLVSLLNQLDGVICHGEVFNPFIVGLRRDIADQFGIGNREVETRDADVANFFNRVVEDHPDKITGFKIFPGHIDYAFDKILANETFRRVILKRDILNSYVSLCQARESGIWKIDSKSDDDIQSIRKMRRTRRRYGAKIHFDPSNFEKYRKKVRKFHRKVENDTKEKGMPLYKIWYKDLFKQKKLSGLIELQICKDNQ